MSLLIRRTIANKEQKKELRRTSRDFRWILKNREKLLKEFNKKYIAIKNEKVCYTSDSMVQMVSLILENGNQVGDYVIEYLSDEQTTLLL